MKKNIILILAVFIGLLACEKDKTVVATYQLPPSNAYLRIMHVSPNFRKVQNQPDSFNVFVGTTKINGSLFTYNSSFPAAGINVNTYAAVPSGSQQIRLSLQGKSTIDSLTIMTLTKTLEAGKYYTFFITDSLSAQQNPTKIWVEDANFLSDDTTQYRIRFAHTVLNDTAGKNVDVYSYRKAGNIFSNISPGTVTDFISLPSPTTLDTISIRRPGTGFELAKINALSIVKGRSYTVIYKGSPGTTGSNVRARSVIVINNK
jgi:uncharacterized protein DUF4397